MRTKILEFAIGMDKVLDANSQKDKSTGLEEGWKHESCTNHYLVGRLIEEVAELIIAVDPNVSRAEAATLLYTSIAKLKDNLINIDATPAIVRKEAFDVGNIVFMLADNAGGVTAGYGNNMSSDGEES